MKKALGIFLIALPFVVFFSWFFYAIGLEGTLICLGLGVLGVIALIIVKAGVYLLQD